MTVIARLKVTLNDVKPPVLRRIDAPVTIRLDRLHLVLQAALHWTNTHVWEIRAGGCGWGPQYEAGHDGPLDASKTRLIDVLEDIGTKTLGYLYDFGDGWEHTIKIERIFDPMPGLDYPILVEAKGRCPPEDVGGPPGYEEFLEAIAAPNHPRHEELTEWRGSFDPNTLDLAVLEADVQALAKRWARKPRARPTVKRRPPT